MRHRILVLLISSMGAELASAQQSPPPCTHRLSGDDDGGFFGVAVDYRGDRILVGESHFFHQHPGGGSAFVFVETDQGWNREARLEPGDSKVGDRFGESVSIEGKLAAIGAPYRDDRTRGSQAGAVYVFERTGTDWTEAARLLPADLTGGDHFGWRVEVEGGRIFVTAPDQAPGGAAYVFEQVRSGWAMRQKLTGQGGVPYENFGSGLAVQRGRVVVGASRARGKLLAERSGAAYVFEYDGQSWNRTHKLYSDEGREGDDVGRSVALDGETILLGGAYYSACGIWIGHAYVFRLVGSDWAEEDEWDPSPAEDFTGFGTDVEIQGDRAFVTARHLYDGPARVYVYERTSSSPSYWAQTDILLGAPPMDYSIQAFGYDLALHGDRLVAGAPTSEFDDGRALIVELPVEQTIYCSGKTNSLGCVPFLTTCGNPRMAGVERFRVGAENLRPDQPSLILYGFGSNQVSFHGGTLCVGGPLERWLPAQATADDGANPICPGRFERDFSKHLRSGVDPLLSVGQTVYAQAWQRDPGDPAGFGDSLTNALSFVIQP